MKLQKTLQRLQKLHPKEIDLSLNRIKKLCNKLGNPQDNLTCIQVAGTNGKYSTIQAIRAILKDANIKCNIYTSPHIQKVNERFVFNDQEISDEDLSKCLIEVEEINNGEPITYFEILFSLRFVSRFSYGFLRLCELVKNKFDLVIMCSHGGSQTAHIPKGFAPCRRPPADG